LLAPSFLACFWEACFWLDFGERSPMGCPLVEMNCAAGVRFPGDAGCSSARGRGM
jgi:hypothetical protein